MIFFLLESVLHKRIADEIGRLEEALQTRECHTSRFRLDGAISFC